MGAYACSSVAAAATDPEQRKGVKTQLTKLKRLLKSSERNRDYFALIKGVQTVLDVYTEDNLLVLSVVVEACRVRAHPLTAADTGSLNVDSTRCGGSHPYKVIAVVLATPEPWLQG